MIEHYEPVWLPVGGGLLICKKHPTVAPFSPGEDPCIECHRKLKRPTTIEIPDYWRPHGTFLMCTYHLEVFSPADEMCSACALDLSDNPSPESSQL